MPITLRQGARVIEDSRRLRLAWSDQGRQGGVRPWGPMSRLQLSLSSDVLIAIGSVSAQWATLEYYMARTTLRCAEKFQNPVSEFFKRVAFVERREAFLESLTWPSVPPEVKEAGVKLIDRIKLAEQNRHTIIHGMASEYTTAEGDPLPANSPKILIAREHPKHWFAERFTLAQIEAIANEIADINGDLLNLYFYLFEAGPPP
jgi:hypothetical protein